MNRKIKQTRLLANDVARMPGLKKIEEQKKIEEKRTLFGTTKSNARKLKGFTGIRQIHENANPTYSSLRTVEYMKSVAVRNQRLARVSIAAAKAEIKADFGLGVKACQHAFGLLKFIVIGTVFYVCALTPATASAANCSIQFGDDGNTYPVSVNLNKGQAKQFSFDEQNVPPSSFIRSTSGPCVFTVFNDFGYKNRFVTIGTNLNGKIRIGTDGVRLRKGGVIQKGVQISKNKEVIKAAKAAAIAMYGGGGDDTQSTEERPDYIGTLRTIKSIIDGGKTWRARSIIIQRVSTACSITVGGNGRSLTYQGARGEKFSSVPAVDFVRKTTGRCGYKVYNETGFQKKSRHYNSGINGKKRVGYRLRSLEIQG